MKQTLIGVLLALTASASTAQSGSRAVLTGNDFLTAHNHILRAESKQSITDGEFAQATLLLGLVQGIVELNRLLSDLHKQSKISTGYLACVPQEVTTKQAALVIRRALEQSPETNHWGVEGLSQMALMKAYRCP
jgi:hypothetical protein